jgi:hypothetical protein
MISIVRGGTEPYARLIERMGNGMDPGSVVRDDGGARGGTVFWKIRALQRAAWRFLFI